MGFQGSPRGSEERLRIFQGIPVVRISGSTMRSQGCLRGFQVISGSLREFQGAFEMLEMLSWDSREVAEARRVVAGRFNK